MYTKYVSIVAAAVVVIGIVVAMGLRTLHHVCVMFGVCIITVVWYHIAILAGLLAVGLVCRRLSGSRHRRLEKFVRERQHTNCDNQKILPPAEHGHLFAWNDSGPGVDALGVFRRHGCVYFYRGTLTFQYCYPGGATVVNRVAWNVLYWTFSECFFLLISRSPNNLLIN